MNIVSFETEKEKLHWVWGQVMELNLDVGLKQSTLDDILEKIQEKIKEITKEELYK